MQIMYMDGQCPKRYQLAVLIRKKDMSKFNESFIKSYDEYSSKGYILEVKYLE